jgi:hypothetical protein
MSSFDHIRAGGIGAQGGTPAAAKSADAADANLSWEWVAGVAGKIGFTVAVVELRFAREKVERAGPGFEQRLGADLLGAQLGHFDALKQGEPCKLFFYLHTETLPAGLKFLRDGLEKLGLLEICKIGIADPAERVWRTWWPPMPAAGEATS